jgi:hypothetical protein
MFEKETTRTPTAIGDLTVVLTTRKNEGDTSETATFIVRVLDQDSKVMRAIDGDLVPYLTQAQVSALLAFMADLRKQAEDQILP